MIDIAFSALLKQCTPSYVPVENMERIISVESSRRVHAIGYKVVDSSGRAFRLDRQPVNKAEAITWATWLYKYGYRFDASIGQVNSSNFAKHGLTPETAFDACQNIRVSAEILYECFLRASKRYGSKEYALQASFSCYNSGNFTTGFATGYVAKILTLK